MWLQTWLLLWWWIGLKLEQRDNLKSDVDNLTCDSTYQSPMVAALAVVIVEAAFTSAARYSTSKWNAKCHSFLSFYYFFSATPLP